MVSSYNPEQFDYEVNVRETNISIYAKPHEGSEESTKTLKSLMKAISEINDYMIWRSLSSEQLDKLKALAIAYKSVVDDKAFTLPDQWEKEKKLRVVLERQLELSQTPSFVDAGKELEALYDTLQN